MPPLQAQRQFTNPTGNLQFGSGSYQYFDGGYLAITQDVFVVSINYRTNSIYFFHTGCPTDYLQVFGFSNSPEIPFGSQNSSILDQRFALQWVQQNIAAFDGDHARITIFGESAGGESVKQLLANPPSPRLFSAAILQSQNTGLVGNGLISYELTLANFNCTDIACLGDVDTMAVKSYTEKNSLILPPVNGDGTPIDDVKPSIVKKKWARVATFFG